MATFKPHKGYTMPENYTEPCMRCFASVTYDVNEPQKNEKTGMYFITCPCCGKEMRVTFANSCLINVYEST